jgi:hypothetical protein
MRSSRILIVMMVVFTRRRRHLNSTASPDINLCSPPTSKCRDLNSTASSSSRLCNITNRYISNGLCNSTRHRRHYLHPDNTASLNYSSCISTRHRISPCSMASLTCMSDREAH